MRKLTSQILRSVMSVALLSPGLVLAAESSVDVVQAGKLTFEQSVRLRHEFVSDEAFAADAQATTVRLRAGLRANLRSGWTGFLEADAVAALAQHYNSGANDQLQYPAVIDPEGADLNQAWLAWRGRMAVATLGRQRLNLNNQRWIGSSGWRQNEQTFDAISLELMPTERWTARVAWLDRVHRVNGDDARDELAQERALSTHLLDVTRGHAHGQWGGYVHAHEDRDMASASSLTVGLRWTRSAATSTDAWTWRLEAARQTQYGNNPGRFTHTYWLVEPSAKWHQVTWRAGWEHLGSNGLHALQTPLATLHLFNGWADKFLVTPAHGLDDVYLGATGSFGSKFPSRLKWTLDWHDYRADQGSGRYGSELDASLGFPLGDKLSGLVKFAGFAGKQLSDVRKLWLQLDWAH